MYTHVNLVDDMYIYSYTEFQPENVEEKNTQEIKVRMECNIKINLKVESVRVWVGFEPAQDRAEWWAH
jgi:hypothetical protein